MSFEVPNAKDANPGFGLCLPHIYQPPICSQIRPYGPIVRSMFTPVANPLAIYRIGEHGPRIKQYQRLLNKLIRGGPQGPPWRKLGGHLWPPLAEDGKFGTKTFEAVKEFQRLLNLPQTGWLDVLTRTLLLPAVKLRGWVRMARPDFSPPPVNIPSTPPSKPAPQQKPTTPTPRVVNVPPPPKKDDDWKLELTISDGVGVSGNVWRGKTPVGTQSQGEPLEWDNKVEVEAALPTPLILGKGHLKLSLSGEYDAPIDRFHLGKPGVQGTFQVEADDMLELGDWGTLSPFVQGSLQWQGGKSSYMFKAGAELKIDLIKEKLSLTGDINSGRQTFYRGLDPLRDPSVVVPLEGNVKFEVKFW
jgi:peptidoglycan hydrolase-like protein with peptidoglycan-binding domain